MGYSTASRGARTGLLSTAIPPSDYLTAIISKIKIKAKTFENCETKNIVKRQHNLHDICFVVPNSGTKVKENSFLPRKISDWNPFEDISLSSSEEIPKSKIPPVTVIRHIYRATNNLSIK